jgi:hypothetical protein
MSNENEIDLTNKNSKDKTALLKNDTKPEDLPTSHSKSSVLSLVSLYETVLKKVREIFKTVKNYCKNTFQFILEKLKSQEEEI